ncbi:MAG: c-type cytochrome biogenesis protein CcsB [Brachybacterium sp.]|nr:c-type cytochrome biogenesis protein CcsB [Brachybacterium sp.]
MINQQLAELSNLLVIIAIVIYVLAMFGFAADLFSTIQARSDARLAAQEKQQALQAAGSGGGVAVMDRAGPLDVDHEPDGTGDTAGDALVRRGMSAARYALIMTAVGAPLHAGAMILRGIATERVPWSNMYEFAMTGSAVVILLFLVMSFRRPQMQALGTFVVVPMLILMLAAQTFWIVPAAALTPSLQNSHWLVIHVAVAIIACALSIIGAIIAGLQLIQGRRERLLLEGTAGHTSVWGIIMDRVPSAKDLEVMSFRVHGIGFIAWTFTLIFGAVWAAEAWGRYWGWDPKEVWTFVIWVIYAAYLHARATRGFRGNRAAWFALAGFAAVVLNFTVVNTVINGLHSYSGLT